MLVEMSRQIIFFTNFDLAEEQLINPTTYVGTVRKNKRHSRTISFLRNQMPIPQVLEGFYKHFTLVFYDPKKNKSTVLLSSMHHDKVKERKSVKPEIIMFLNTMKGAVDIVDQLCHSYSVQRKTKSYLAFELFYEQHHLGIRQCFDV